MGHCRTRLSHLHRQTYRHKKCDNCNHNRSSRKTAYITIIFHNSLIINYLFIIYISIICLRCLYCLRWACAMRAMGLRYARAVLMMCL